jgi:hypothetical protein
MSKMLTESRFLEMAGSIESSLMAAKIRPAKMIKVTRSHT